MQGGGEAGACSETCWKRGRPGKKEKRLDAGRAASTLPLPPGLAQILRVTVAVRRTANSSSIGSVSAMPSLTRVMACGFTEVAGIPTRMGATKMRHTVMAKRVRYNAGSPEPKDHPGHR